MTIENDFFKLRAGKKITWLMQAFKRAAGYQFWIPEFLWGRDGAIMEKLSKLMIDIIFG
jgi:hypothetical protein